MPSLLGGDAGHASANAAVLHALTVRRSPHGAIWDHLGSWRNPVAQSSRARTSSRTNCGAEGRWRAQILAGARHTRLEKANGACPPGLRRREMPTADLAVLPLNPQRPSPGVVVHPVQAG